MTSQQQQQQQQQDKLKQLGNTLVQREEYEQASKFYDRALELDSTSEAAAAIFSNRSLCFLNINIKKYKDALQDAEKAISLRPTWHRGYQRAAAACEQLEKHEEGLKHLEKCFELDEASKDDSALKKLKETFEVSFIKQKAPSMTQDELKQIGNTFVKNQQYESAIAVYTLAIEKDAFCDEAVPILSNRSMAYFKIGKYKEAYEDGGFCCGIKPDWAKGFMRRGVAAEQLQDWQIALESYDEYLKLDPKDEAGVTENRIHVKKQYDEELKAIAREKMRLQQADTRLTNEKNPREKILSLYFEFMAASSSLSKEGIQLARKHGLPRLDTLFNPAKLALGESEWLLPEGLAKTKEYFATHSNDQAIQTILSFCISTFSQKQRFFAASRKVAEQVSFLDFLLDIAEEEKYVRPQGYKFETWLEHICSHTKDVPIRKDLIFVLFDRIKIAKRIFLSESASDGEFGTMVLSSIFANHGSELKGLDSTDICTQDMYEGIQTCLKAGANLKKTDILLRSIHSLRSLRVVELLLRYGANPNEYSSNIKIESCLCASFYLQRTDIARALISNGAKFEEKPTPKEYLDMVGDHPLLTKTYAPDLFSAVPIATLNSATEDLFQLLFECLTSQNLSFISFQSAVAPHGLLLTIYQSPLSMVIVSPQPTPQLIQTMLKLKPALATLPITSNLHSPKTGDFFVMPMAVLFGNLLPVGNSSPLGTLSQSNASKMRNSSGKEQLLSNFEFFHKVIAIALVEAGFDVYKHPMVLQKKKGSTSIVEVNFEGFLTYLIGLAGTNEYIVTLRSLVLEITKKPQTEEPPKKKVVPLPKRGRGGRR